MQFFVVFQNDELPKVMGAEQEFIFIRLNILREYLERELLMDNLPFKYDFEVNHFTFTYSVQYVNRWTFKIFLVLKIQDIQKRFNFCPNCFIISVEARAKGGKEYKNICYFLLAYLTWWLKKKMLGIALTLVNSTHFQFSYINRHIFTSFHCNDITISCYQIYSQPQTI